MVEIKLFNLLEVSDWYDLQLVAQLIKSLGYQTNHLNRMIEKITRKYIQDFLPDSDYHRFGCTMLDKLTFELIYKKINEFFILSHMEVEVNYELLKFKTLIICENKKNSVLVENNFEDLTAMLYYSLSAKYRIEKNNFSF